MAQKIDTIQNVIHWENSYFQTLKFLRIVIVDSIIFISRRTISFLIFVGLYSIILNIAESVYVWMDM